MSNYENGPEEIERIPRMPDAVLECIISRSLFRNHANRYEGEDRDRLHGLMHDTAEEVLARVSLAAPSVASAANCDELPLPTPCNTVFYPNGTAYLAKKVPGPKAYFDSDQIRAHARAAVLAEREACAKLCAEISEDRYSLYKGRTPYLGNEEGRADTAVAGQSSGADLCEEAIRARN